MLNNQEKDLVIGEIARLSAQLSKERHEESVICVISLVINMLCSVYMGMISVDAFMDLTKRMNPNMYHFYEEFFGQFKID